MSLRLASAIKAELETAALGIPWFVYEAPINDEDDVEQEIPYGIIFDGLGEADERTGNGLTKRTVENIQVDIYEAKPGSPTLGKLTKTTLQQARLVTAPEYVYRIEQLSRQRQNDFNDPDAVRTTITGQVRRRNT